MGRKFIIIAGLSMLFCFYSPRYSAITGLSFSSDTVYGSQTVNEPKTLVVRNLVNQDIQIDSIRLLPADFLFALGSVDYGGAYRHIWVLAYGDSNPFGFQSPKGPLLRSNDSLIAGNFLVSTCFCLLKRRMGLSLGDTLFHLNTIFYSRHEADTILFVVHYIETEPVEQNGAPGEIGLAVSPNPFNPTARISFACPDQAAGEVSFMIYNVSGKLVRTLPSHLSGGRTEFAWDGTDMAGNRLGSGVYVGRVAAGGRAAEVRLLLAK